MEMKIFHWKYIFIFFSVFSNGPPVVIYCVLKILYFASHVPGVDFKKVFYPLKDCYTHVPIASIPLLFKEKITFSRQLKNIGEY